MLQIRKYNEAYLLITGERSEEQELSDYFTFNIPNARFQPKFRAGLWDGKIRIYNTKTKLIYYGLLENIIEFCNQKEIKYELLNTSLDTEYSLHEFREFYNNLSLPFEPRDYQEESVVNCIRKSRLTLLSPTASGKSFIIYLLTRFYNRKTIIIVPTTSLIHQMSSDFEQYGYTEPVHKIFSRQEKDSNHNITVATWQSLYKMPKKWFDQFEVCIVDECHLAKAQSLTKIMTNLDKCKYRFGFTGTLDGTQTNKMVIEGLFGPILNVITTSKLIEEKHLAEFKIKCIVLNYSDDRKKIAKQYSYQDEIEFIVGNKKRNNFIKNLALSLKGNTLVLFQFVEKHGQILYDMIKDSTDRDVYFIHGQIDGKDRDDIRKIVENKTDCIIIASSQTFSTGINIRSLENIIFSSPSKSRIKTLQSIGRVLRKSEQKTKSQLFDIADNLSWKSKKNYTILHFLERLKIYNQEKFPYKTYNVELEK